MSSLRAARGALVARLLARAWRSASLSSPDLSPNQLQEILDLLLQSGAGPLAWRRIRASELANSAAAERLHTSYRVQSLRAAQQQTRIAPLIEKFRARGVDPILLKGWSLARLYPEPGLRPYSDVDLIIAPRQAQAAKAVLADSQGIDVDLEHDEITRFDHTPWSDLYSRSRLFPLGDTQVRVLGGEDQLRALCLHFLKHGGWGPLWLCDIALLVESRPANFDWDLCLGRHRKRRSWLASALWLAHHLLGMELQGAPLAFETDKFPQWIIGTVLHQWGSPPLAYRATFRSYLRHPGRIGEAIADRWPPNPIVSTLISGARFGACPRLLLQAAEVLSRIAKCFRGDAVSAAEKLGIRTGAV